MNKEIEEEISNLYHMVGDAILGDKLTIIKVIDSVSNLPHLLHNLFFIRKLDKLLSESATIKERNKLAEMLLEDKDRRKFTEYIISVVDKIETEDKIMYVINATRSLCMKYISLEEYYRMLHLIVRCLCNDLLFMALHIHESNMVPNESVYELLSDGLMFNSIVSENEENKYSFVPFAYKLVKYSIKYDEYSNTYEEAFFCDKINDKASTKIEYLPESLYRNSKGENILLAGLGSTNNEICFTLMETLNKFKRFVITVEYQSREGKSKHSHEIKSNKYPENFSEKDINTLVTIPIKSEADINIRISSLNSINISINTTKKHLVGSRVEIMAY